MQEQTFEIEANSLEEAKAQINSRLSQGFDLISDQILDTGEQKKIKQIDETTETAISMACSQIPEKANIIEINVVQIPYVDTIKISSDNDVSARNLAESSIDANTIIKNIVLAAPAKKGFLGIGKSLNQYDVKVLKQAIVEITYRGNVKLIVRIGALRTVKIKDQVWMAENLNISFFRNGDSIPEAKTDEEWKRAYQLKSPAWCYYDNNPNNGKIYGRLYNWYAVQDSRGLAPKGWHIPSDREFRTLLNNCVNDASVFARYYALVKGGSSGFNSLLGGNRSTYSGFVNFGSESHNWQDALQTHNWTNPPKTVESVRYFCLHKDHSYGTGVADGHGDKGDGCSVRCLKD